MRTSFLFPVLGLVLSLLTISGASAQTATVRPALPTIRAQRPAATAKSNENLLDVAVSDCKLPLKVGQ